MGSEWETTTVIRKGHKNAKDARSSSAINQAMAQGNVEIQKKRSAGGNKAHGAPTVSLAKIEQESEKFKVDTVDRSVSKAIIEGRQKKNLTQKDLANQINEKLQVIQEYEQGKAVPSQQVLGKMERALGVRLRGAKIGEPL